MLLVCGGFGGFSASAQSNLPIYTDSLQSGFQDWSWASRNLNNTSPVYSGTRSISVTASYWQGLSFWHSELDTSPYASFTFWAHGGISGGQRLQVYAQYGTSSGPAYVLPGALPANAWQKYSIPLQVLGIANTRNFNRINLQLMSGGTTGTYYVDDVEFTASPVPGLVRVELNATRVVREVDERHFGVNLAIWDGYFDPPHDTTTISLLREMGCTAVRMPGGSLSDEYHFDSNTTLSNTWQWQTSFPDFMRVFTNSEVTGFVTVNYGSGSPQEAAAWVAYANASANLFGTPADILIGPDATGKDWKTAGYWSRLRSLTAAQNPENKYDFLAIGRSAPFGIKHWEVGNECYGTWERDNNPLRHHAHTYAVRSADYMSRMRAIDPAIKIGVVAVPGESSYANGYSDHPALNPRTGQTNYGWTPVMLATLRSLGVTPDFLVHHVYPQWTNPDNPASSPSNDSTLLQATGNWEMDAVDLRQQISDYFGPGGSAIEVVCTENNSDAGAQGRQSTSLVNGIYYADSLGQLLKTEFNGFVWWDFRNGTDRNGFFGPGIYGWRDYGDLGMINGPSTRHPSFYATKMMRWFARPGDKVLQVVSEYPWLSAHAARRTNGAVSLLLINKSLLTGLNAEIIISGFVPAPSSEVRFFGIPNDEAARTNAPLALQDITASGLEIAGTNVTLSLPMLSLTLVTLTPEAPRLRIADKRAAGEIAIELNGQVGVPYVVQSSGDLATWTSVATNILTAPPVSITNLTSGVERRFWRAVWLP
jgi:alpha-L-arabinofuranosidase